MHSSWSWGDVLLLSMSLCSAAILCIGLRSASAGQRDGGLQARRRHRILQRIALRDGVDHQRTHSDDACGPQSCGNARLVQAEAFARDESSREFAGSAGERGFDGDRAGVAELLEW